MSLPEIWRSNPTSIKAYAIRQVVAIAGDGRLRDGSLCSIELRSFLREVPPEKLAEYSVECLETTFDDSGLVLQDVVNEAGRRLGFDVEDGRYRGKQGVIGFDGIWRAGKDISIILEVKTTDTYNVRLEDVAGYRESLIKTERVPAIASTLFVVGRKDTGALEAQIRGSRYAWDMRVVGVDSLMKLMRIAVKSNETSTIRQIRELLRPVEYTRIDRIVDVVFDTAQDVEQSSDGLEVQESQPIQVACVSAGGTQERTASSAMNEMRARIVAGLQDALGVPLVQRRRAFFESADGSTRACITISKRYDRDSQPYWYAYHPAWNEFLNEAPRGVFVLGCMDRSEAFAIPVASIASFLPKLNQTIREDGSAYWHIILAPLDDGTLALYSSRTGEKLPLRPFSIVLPKRG